jgi:predicted lipoprotein with Yx(FWY)xxD motif
VDSGAKEPLGPPARTSQQSRRFIIDKFQENEKENTPMSKRRTWLVAAAVLTLLVAVLPYAAIVPTALAAPPSIGVAKHATLGNILTDGNGMTLYVYKNDSAGQSTCTGGCAQTWPPFAVPDQTQLPVLPEGVTGKVDAVTRPDGTYQVAFNGMPLYLYSGDTKAGDTNGQGIGNVWSVLATNPPASAASGSQNNYAAASGNSYSNGSPSSGNNYGYGMNNYGGYGMNNYGGYGMNNYRYSYIIPYRPYVVPRFHVVPYFRRFPLFFHQPFIFHRFTGSMGMMRRY